jgi:hypothetical protein
LFVWHHPALLFSIDLSTIASGDEITGVGCLVASIKGGSDNHSGREIEKSRRRAVALD